MEYTRSVESKKRMIASFFRYRKSRLDENSDCIPYSLSLYSLADTLSSLDYAFEQGYKSQCGKQPQKHKYYTSMAELVETMMEYQSDSSVIAMVLGYKEEDVIMIKSAIERERAEGVPYREYLKRLEDTEHASAQCNWQD